MHGTFKDGDFLWISAVPLASLQVGDVVAFSFNGKSIAHRIVGRDESGFVTQGDRNLGRDGPYLTTKKLLGKVMERERAGIRSAVVDGSRGLRRAFVLRTAKRVRNLVSLTIATPYRLTCASRLAPLLWRPQIMTAHFAEGEKKMTKFIHRGKTVACWVPHEQRWTCRKPYDLILSPPNV